MEEGSDRWAPPVDDSGTQDPLVGGRREGENAGVGGEAGPRLAARWAEGKNRGEKVLGLRADFHGEGGGEK